MEDSGEGITDEGVFDLGSFMLFPSSIRETGGTHRAVHDPLSPNLTSLNSLPATILAPLLTLHQPHGSPC